MSEIAMQELETRIAGMTEEEKSAALKCFKLQDLIKEIAARTSMMESMLNNISNTIGRQR